jgi:hypothetical protein
MADYRSYSDLKENYWLIAADMGYGHHRAIYPLRDLSSNNEILNANISSFSTPREQRLWKNILRIYEFMSRAGNYPFIGNFISKVLDKALYIPKFYPRRDMSNSTNQVKYLKSRIKKGLCNGIIEEIRRPTRPILTSFYAPAIAAEMAGYKEIYCIICDTDMSRVWVAESANESRIIYFAPGTESVQRLRSYGVSERNIILTGFPLPLELLGDRSLNILKKNLKRRLLNLDPNGRFYNLYKHSVDAFLEEDIETTNDESSYGSITLTYVVGGAGAQKETASAILKSLKELIEKGRIKINLVAGTRSELRDYFNTIKIRYTNNSENVRVIWAKSKSEYFDLFNESLHSTDILWTKPSELSFYCGLGLPVIMSPAIGPQEKFNRRWLIETGAGIKQKNPEFTDEWLTDIINNGRLAEAAWLGFLKARKYGTYNILDYLEKGIIVPSNDPLKR